MELTTQNLAKLLDASKLRPDTTQKDVLDFCDEVRQFKFGAAYVMPANLTIMREELAGYPTKLGTCIAFPFGAQTTMTKCREIEEAIVMGAEMVDVVINIGALRSGNTKQVRDELQQLVKAAQPSPLKVILEVSYLSPQEIATGAEICVEVEAAFVKTGTGYGSRPTTLEDVSLIAKTVQEEIGIKVAGGVQDIHTLLRMMEVGASSFGVSRGRKLMDEFEKFFGGRYSWAGGKLSGTTPCSRS